MHQLAGRLNLCCRVLDAVAAQASKLSNQSWPRRVMTSKQNEQDLNDMNDELVQALQDFKVRKHAAGSVSVTQPLLQFRGQLSIELLFHRLHESLKVSRSAP